MDLVEQEVNVCVCVTAHIREYMHSVGEQMHAAECACVVCACVCVLAPWG